MGFFLFYLQAKVYSITKPIKSCARHGFRDMKMKKLLRLMLLACAVLLGMGLLTAQTEEKEVKSKRINNGGETSKMIPLNGGKADNYCKCEFVVPASSLSFMKGNLVKEIRFNCIGKRQWGSARFRVFIKEIEKTELSDYQGSDNATIVYDGSLATDNMLAVPFSAPYEYKGGNLLIGVYQISPGSKDKLSFFGEKVKGASIVGCNKEGLDNITAANSSIIDFCPEMLFFYQEKPVLHYVDLGLPSGTLWATAPITEKENGPLQRIIVLKYGWGDTEDVRYHSSYKYGENIGTYGAASITKYCNDWKKGKNGFTDNKLFIEPEDDASIVKWGSEWRMPTKQQCEELLKYTVKYQEKGGCRLKSVINGKEIVLPVDDRGNNCYWTAALDQSNPDKAFVLKVSDTGGNVFSEYRNHSFAILPVLSNLRGKPANPKVRRDKDMCNHEYVDLGLPSGTLWATCNVGAEKPEEFGDYYSWGGTVLQIVFGWKNYKFGLENNLTKYCYNYDPKKHGKDASYITRDRVKYGKNGYADNLLELEPEDDVATYRWGNDWCMPTKEQCEELLANTVRERKVINGVHGWLLRAANGNSIFFPANSYIEEKYCINENADYFSNVWTKTLVAERYQDAGGNPNFSFGMGLYTGEVIPVERCFGAGVRPVRSSAKK